MLFTDYNFFKMTFIDPASPLMYGIIELHDHIFFFLNMVLFLVLFLLVTTLKFFSYERNSTVNRYLLSESTKNRFNWLRLNHGTTIEIIWTVVPSIILILIAIPSFALLYATDEIIDPAVTVKVIGHQWYWSYEYNDLTITSTHEKFPLWGDGNSKFGDFISPTKNPLFILSLITEKAHIRCCLFSGSLIKINADPFNTNPFFFGGVSSKPNMHVLLNRADNPDISVPPHVYTKFFKRNPLDAYINLFKDESNLEDVSNKSSEEEKLNNVLARFFKDNKPALPICDYNNEIWFSEKTRKILSNLRKGEANQDLLVKVLKGDTTGNSVVVQPPLENNKPLPFLTSFDSHNISKLLSFITDKRLEKEVNKELCTLVYSTLCFPYITETNLISGNFEFDSYMRQDSDLLVGEKRLYETDFPLVLPKNTHIRFMITADDVIHSWSVPALGIKVDAVPGRINHAHTFIKRSGTFYGQCSELCGVNHAFMPIQILVFEPSMYYDYIRLTLLNK